MKRYATLVVLVLGGFIIGRSATLWVTSPSPLQLEPMFNTNDYTVVVQPDTKPAPGKTVTFTVSVANAPRNLSAHIGVASHNLKDFWFYDDSYEIEHIDAQNFQFTHTFTEADKYTLWIEMHNAEGHLHETHIIESVNPGHIDFLATAALDLGNAKTTNSIADISDEDEDGEFRMRIDSPTFQARKPQRLRFEAEHLNGDPAQLYTTGGDWYVIVDPVSKLFLLHSVDTALSDEDQRTTPEISLPHAGKYALWFRTFSASDNPDVGLRFGAFISTVFVIEALPNDEPEEDDHHGEDPSDIEPHDH